MKTDIQDGKEPSGHDTARTAGVAVAAATFGAAAAVAVNQDSASSGKRALIQYDYEKAEDNELELVEGEYVTNIEMVDDDWWMGTNGKGESGLFPSNYVELVEDDEEETQAQAPPPPAPVAEPEPEAAPSGSPSPTATAIYDYEAAEDNELSFDEGATITGLVRLPLSLPPSRKSKSRNRARLTISTGIPRRRLVVRPFPRQVRSLPCQLCSIGRVEEGYGCRCSPFYFESRYGYMMA